MDTRDPIAHHADFDRKFVERRLPDAKGLAWACSCHEIDWQAAGFRGVGLGWLLAQAGYFFNGAHRAGADVAAVDAAEENSSVIDVTPSTLVAAEPIAGWGP